MSNINKNKYGVKLLLCAFSGGGKTHALKTLDPNTSLVLSVDGKVFPLKMPHMNISYFNSVAQLLYGSELVEATKTSVEIPKFVGLVEVMRTFKEKMGHLPRVFAVDTVSRIVEIIHLNAMKEFAEGNTMDAYPVITRETAEFFTFIEDKIISRGIDVVSLSHVSQDPKTNKFSDTSFGAFKRNGGILSTHDNAYYIEIVGDSRTVHIRTLGKPCRTLLSEDVVDNEVDIDDFNLKDTLELLRDIQNTNEEFLFN